MPHRFEHDDPFHHHLQPSQLRYMESAEAAATSPVENQTGLFHE